MIKQNLHETGLHKGHDVVTQFCLFKGVVFVGVKLQVCSQSCVIWRNISGTREGCLISSILPTVILPYGSILSTGYELSYTKHLFSLFCLLDISET